MSLTTDVENKRMILYPYKSTLGNLTLSSASDYDWTGDTDNNALELHMSCIWELRQEYVLRSQSFDRPMVFEITEIRLTIIN